MFYTFVPPQTNCDGNLTLSHSRCQITKRRRTSAACDRCRSNRIRCEDPTPCSQCVATNARCRRSQARRSESIHHHSASQSPKLRNAHRGGIERSGTIPRRRHDLLLSKDLEEDTITYPQADYSLKDPRETSQNSFRINSDVAIVEPTLTNPLGSSTGSVSSKIDFFIAAASKALHQHPQDPLPIDYDTPISVYQTSSLDSNVDPVTALAKREVDCCLSIFWQFIHIDTPILDKAIFQAYYESIWTAEEEQHTVSPLVDAITALASQYAQGTDLIGRTLGMRHLRTTYHGDVGLAAFCYLRRCRQTIDGIGTFAEPSLTTVQTYVFMTMYLLNAGQYQTAYTTIGVGIRIANVLNLHKEPPQTLAQKEAEMRRTLWWTLVQLDLKCSVELGRPMATNMSTISCSLPSIEHQVMGLQVEYHIWNAKLTSAILSVTQNLAYMKHDNSGNDAVIVELGVEDLGLALQPLEDWKEEISMSSISTFLNLQTNLSGTTDVHFIPTWLQRHTCRLSVHYHDALNTLYRPFIGNCLLTRLNGGFQTPQADLVAMRSLQHASSIIDIIHQTFNTSDILYGSYELYMLEWNAVLSLIGFALAYPNIMDVATVVEKLDRALLLFELGEGKHAVAKRAAALTRSLRARMDRIIKGPGPDKAGVEPQNSDTQSQSQKSKLDYFTEREHWVSDVDLGDVDLWVQTLDPDLWADYYTNIYELSTGGDICNI